MPRPRGGLAGSSQVALVLVLVIAVAILAYLLVLKPSPGQTATTTDLAGLQLRLSVSPGVIAQGDNVSIEISEFNTLTTWNDVPTTTYSTLSTTFCPGPLGVGIFQGDYSSGNISTAQRLELFYPGVSGCSAYLGARGVFYLFAPESDNTSYSPFGPVTVTHTVTGNGTTSVQYVVTTPVTTQELAADLSFSGYWTGSAVPPLSNATFDTFSPGTYTVEGVDWWGHVTFAHFQVVPNADA